MHLVSTSRVGMGDGKVWVSAMADVGDGGKLDLTRIS
jgi:hypothetical protein